jgi:hypothetical protein
MNPSRRRGGFTKPLHSNVKYLGRSRSEARSTATSVPELMAATGCLSGGIERTTPSETKCSRTLTSEGWLKDFCNKKLQIIRYQIERVFPQKL